MKIVRKELYHLLMEAYLDARKNERNNLSQIEFELELEKNIWDLREDILKRRYKPSPLVCFIIEEPVKREVFAPMFRDRVVSHLLFKFISPLFEKTFIYDSYSCRVGKGTLFGINRSEHHIRSITDNYTKTAYGLSIDISGYFMSIERKRLLTIVKTKLESFRYRKTKDGKTLDDTLDFDLIYFLLETIIMRDPLERCIVLGGKKNWEGLPKDKSLFCAKEGVGIIIGDLMSQLFSNIYLNEFDNYVKRVLHIRHYGRYVDDAYIFHENKEYLKSLIPDVQRYLYENLGLKLNMKKVKIFSLNHNFKFLGVCMKPYRKYIKNKSVKTFRKKIREIEKSIKKREPTKEEIESYLSVLNSYLGYFKRNKTFRIINNVLGNSVLKEYFLFRKNYEKAMIYKLNK